MATFATTFLGCKVSYTDAQEIRELLAAGGHVEAEGDPEVAVVNTCCVTHEAVRKSRQEVRRAAHRAQRVYVTGCAANLPESFDDMPANVEVVRLPSERAAAFVSDSVGALGCVRAHVGLERVRAFVKIQDGCSFSCAFCVIPRVRGRSRSRAAGAVLREVERRVDQGHREIVLTGINLGCYRDRAAGYDLARLLREVAAVPGVERLRLSSLEVNHLSESLVAAMRETANVSPHLHVPLQSGDDGVLGAMGRRYDVATYLRRVERAEGFNLTSDVIVGFPTEDDAAFERTLRAVEAAGITKVHVFPYSPRPGTRTASADPVPPAVKKERSARLRGLSAEACRRRWAGKLGGEETVLVDRPGRGYGDDYTPWLVDAPTGRFVRARAHEVTEEGIVGLAA
jgi:threonylcarbamoyladenosine tRNA methylthiotransferase MtaB